MKNIYVKIILGILSLGLIYFVDQSLLWNVDTFFVCFLIFILPIIFYSGTRLYLWTASYILLGLSLWYTTIIPPSLKSLSGSCSGIFCNMDGRPITFILIYLSVLIILAIWQLVTFVKQRKLKNNLVK